MALFWRKNNSASLLGYSKNHVDVEVRAQNGKQWRMTCFHGHLDHSRTWESWGLLESLKAKSLLPWVVIGDFNNLLFQYEKRGGNPYPNHLLRGFGETLDGCGLIQLPMWGHQFTWEKSRGTDNWIEERLDKVLATADWMRGVGGGGSGLAGRRVEGLLNCQQRCGERLMRWGGENFHKFGERIGRLKKRQGAIRNRRDPAALAEFHQIDVLLARLEAQEDVFWRQRAKQHWLRGANANTRFYHRGNDMCSVILDYFRQIYTTESTAFDDAMLDNFAPRVTHAQNEYLLRPFGPEDVKEAISSMYPDKVPGPDGLNPGFYQHFWDDETTNGGPDLRVSSAFIPGRLIMDNILVAAEVGHYLNRKQCGLTGWSALKLDMSKAYDRMEWAFLQRMLCAFGFDQRWLPLLCIASQL
ncbi:PREDICTED: uncharacterized protein LOC109153730 [Ipomoea nil]|uniref:uncharacterized protein LOC109153730 n=1 Tax=Ipomoea nil TaxID=35883 RepID=UPI000901E417|nr:PREDICTED: uncharacterized protein LOC109153730 [Ipomoea nil]